MKSSRSLRSSRSLEVGQPSAGLPGGKQRKLPYLDFGDWLRDRFPWPVQKLAVDAGFTCPNRDGTVGTGGCAFCNNSTFSPRYTSASRSVTQQLTDGKGFFAAKHRGDVHYLAYFQSYSNTYAPVERLESLYREALAVPGVVGLVIGTRPDCLPPPVLDLLQRLASDTFVLVELGIESANDATLQRVGRGHDFACASRAAHELHRRGVLVGAHVILGLPGEDEQEMLRQATVISQLPITVLKLHQLQVVRGTRLAQQWQEKPFALFTAQQYASLVARYVQRLRPGIALDRFVSMSPQGMVLAPHWGLKPDAFQRLLLQEMQRIKDNSESHICP